MISPASFADLFILHSFLFLVNLFLAFFCFLFLSSSRVPYQYTLSLPLCKEKISQYFVIFFFYQFTSPFLYTFPAVPALRSHLFWIVIYGWLILVKKRIQKVVSKGIKKEPAACYCRTAVLSSPLWCLTSVFGMGTGVSIMLSLPDLL